MSAVEIEVALSELSLQSFFNADDFAYDFLAAFGHKDTTPKCLRAGNNNSSDVPSGVLLRNNIHIAVCATDCVGDTLKTLLASPATGKAKAKFVLATDGVSVEAQDLNSGESIASAYADFPDYFGLFSGSTEVPRFSRIARAYLIKAGNLNWKQINPDIFGSMIQAVADDSERGALGMHYTSVPNILKVLNRFLWMICVASWRRPLITYVN